MNESSLKWVTWLSESPVDYLEKLGQPMAREENLVRKRIRTTNPQNISSSDTRNFHWNPQSIKKLAEWPHGTYFTSTGEFRRNNLMNLKKKKNIKLRNRQQVASPTAATNQRRLAGRAAHSAAARWWRRHRRAGKRYFIILDLLSFWNFMVIDLQV